MGAREARGGPLRRAAERLRRLPAQRPVARADAVDGLHERDRGHDPAVRGLADEDRVGGVAGCGQAAVAGIHEAAVVTRLKQDLRPVGAFLEPRVHPRALVRLVPDAPLADARRRRGGVGRRGGLGRAGDRDAGDDRSVRRRGRRGAEIVRAAVASSRRLDEVLVVPRVGHPADGRPLAGVPVCGRNRPQRSRADHEEVDVHPELVGDVDECVPPAPGAGWIVGRIGRVEVRGPLRRVGVGCDQLPDERDLDGVDPERVQRRERLQHVAGRDVDELVVVEQRGLLGGRRECM